MIVRNPNEFINNEGRVFTLPFKNFDDDDKIGCIIEFNDRVVINFSMPYSNHSDNRNVVCFDRHTAELLWVIESAVAWKVSNNRNMYLDEEFEDKVILYSSVGLAAYYQAENGNVWIEEFFNEDRKEIITGLEEKGFVERYPAYHNNKKYKLKKEDYYIKNGTSELVKASDYILKKEEISESDNSGTLAYIDLKDLDAGDCLISIISNYGSYIFDLDGETGKVRPAYAIISEDK